MTASLATGAGRPPIFTAAACAAWVVTHRGAFVVSLLLLATLGTPGGAMAHDDPILAVRVLCSGLTDGQIDVAMGEVDDNATLFIDQLVVGRPQIEAWMVEQLRLNLRIEIIDILPVPVGDGYEVTWTTRMFREDWRKAGNASRATTERATIHNGKITRWTSSLTTELAPDVVMPPVSEVASEAEPGRGPPIAGVPLSQIPVALLGLAVIVPALIVGVSLYWWRGSRA